VRDVVKRIGRREGVRICARFSNSFKAESRFAIPRIPRNAGRRRCGWGIEIGGAGKVSESKSKRKSMSKISARDCHPVELTASGLFLSQYFAHLFLLLRLRLLLLSG
jgi:hypothetical protein